VTALQALPGRVILKELHLIPALRAFDLENRPRFPELTILSWAFHDTPLL